MIFYLQCAVLIAVALAGVVGIIIACVKDEDARFTVLAACLFCLVAWSIAGVIYHYQTIPEPKVVAHSFYTNSPMVVSNLHITYWEMPVERGTN